MIELPVSETGTYKVTKAVPDGLDDPSVNDGVQVDGLGLEREQRPRIAREWSRKEAVRALSGLIPVWTNTPRIHRATTVLVILGAVHDELCRAVED